MVSAKEGGARTIAESYLKFINLDRDNDYVVYAPKWSESINLNSNVNLKMISKSGFEAFFFSIFTIGFISYFYKATKIVSFSNINAFFTKAKRITYFHQCKVFNKVELKTLLYRFCIRFQKNSYFIVQTDLVKKKFVDFFSIKDDRVHTVWPGIDTSYVKDESVLNEELIDFKGDNSMAIIPYYDTKAEHKNFKAILDNIDYYYNQGLRVVVTSDKPIDFFSDKIFFIGLLSKDQLFTLYNHCDIMLFPSKVETIGLPIFEFISFNKACYVQKANYSNYFVDTLGISSSIRLIDFNAVSNVKFEASNSNIYIDSKIFEHEWSKLEHLITGINDG
ncbi:hypothetical protein [Vibrio sp. 10N.222.55.C7]|uniref:hypothetical protein n=1 Tax=Vibrio sp. 10N.222.55.C7 TaxID=3229650 RepID=UPI0035532993